MLLIVEDVPGTEIAGEFADGAYTVGIQRQVMLAKGDLAPEFYAAAKRVNECEQRRA